MLGLGSKQVALELMLKGKDAGAKAALEDVDREGKKTESTMQRIGEAGHRAGQRIAAGMRLVRNVVRGIAIVFGALMAGPTGGGLISKWALNATSAMETFRAKLVTATKDVAKAGQVMQWATEQAAKTPFQLPDVIDTVVRLMNYRLPVAEWFQLVGNMAGAMGRNITDAVEAIADAVSGGGLERLKEFGISATQLKEWGYIGDYTAKGIESMKQALRGLMTERFGGGMAAMMDTIAGKVSNFQDAIFRLRHAIGERIAPTFKAILDHATKLVDTLARSGMAQKFGDFLANGMLRAYNWMVKLTLGLKDSIPKWVHGVIEFARSFYAVIYELVWKWGVLDLKIARTFELAKLKVYEWADEAILAAREVGLAIADAVEAKGAALGGKVAAGSAVAAQPQSWWDRLKGSASWAPTGTTRSSMLGGIGGAVQEIVMHFVTEWLERQAGKIGAKVGAGVATKSREIATGIREALPEGSVFTAQRAAATQRANELAMAMDIRRGGFLLLGEKLNRGFDKLGDRFDAWWKELWGPAISGGEGIGAPGPMRMRPEHAAYLRGRAKFGGLPSHLWGATPAVPSPLGLSMGQLVGVVRIEGADRGTLALSQEAAF